MMIKKKKKAILKKQTRQSKTSKSKMEVLPYGSGLIGESSHQLPELFDYTTMDSTSVVEISIMQNE